MSPRGPSGLSLHGSAERRTELVLCFQPRMVPRVRNDVDLAVEAGSETSQGVGRAAVAGPADDHRAGRQALAKFVHV